MAGRVPAESKMLALHPPVCFGRDSGPPQYAQHYRRAVGHRCPFRREMCERRARTSLPPARSVCCRSSIHLLGYLTLMGASYHCWPPRSRALPCPWPSSDSLALGTDNERNVCSRLRTCHEAVSLGQETVRQSTAVVSLRLEPSGCSTISRKYPRSSRWHSGAGSSIAWNAWWAVISCQISTARPP